MNKLRKLITQIILKQEGQFNPQDIFNKVENLELLQHYSDKDIKNCIKIQLNALCEVNLVKNTLLYYYVR